MLETFTKKFQVKNYGENTFTLKRTQMQAPEFAVTKKKSNALVYFHFRGEMWCKKSLTVEQKSYRKSTLSYKNKRVIDVLRITISRFFCQSIVARL